MTRQTSLRYLAVVFASLLIFSGGLSLSIGYAAQFVDTNITSSGLGTNVACVAGTCNITGGTRPHNGTNLFFSFGNFNLDAPDNANFLNESGLATANILSRDTSGTPSNIFGTIKTTGFPNANFFFMNRAGINFGATAQLNVEGSFHATTADYIKLGDGTIFAAKPPPNEVLTTAPPTAFGFLTSAPASINVTSADLFNPLKVEGGQTLSFVGGTVNLGASDGSTPAYVLAPSGRINLVAGGLGEVAFDGTGFHVDGVANPGSINIGANSIVDGKEVFIRGGELTIGTRDPAVPDGPVLPGLIAPGAFSFFGLAPPPNGGQVNVNVSGEFKINGTQLDPIFGLPSGIFAFAGSFGDVDPLVKAKVPDITIQAGSLSLSGVASIVTNKVGPGDSANVRIKADTVTVENGAAVLLINAYGGPGDTLTVEAKDIELIGNGGASLTGFASQAFFHPSYFTTSIDPALSFAESGPVTVNATNSLTVRNGAQITTDSRSFGGSGNIKIKAGKIIFSDSPGQVSAQSLFAGDSGNLMISADRIDISNGFVLSVNTFGSGKSGNAEIVGNESINITGVASGIASQTVPPPAAELDAFARLILGPGATFPELATALGVNSDLFAVLGALNGLGLTAIPGQLVPGDGGNLLIKTLVLAISGRDSAIDSSTAWDGHAGQVNLNVGTLTVRDDAQIRSRSGLVNLMTGDLVVGTGNAGDITVVATAPNTIMISGDESTISTTTFGDGNAGNISLDANQVKIENGGSVTSTSGGTVNGQLIVGTGNAGQITVSTPTLTMGTGGTVSVATLGAGNAGNITMNVGNFTQTGGARVDSSTSGGGSGGDLSILAANSATLSGAGTGLFSTASSTGAGGDINVQSPQVKILDGAIMSANSTGTATATAGNVNIVTSDLDMQSSSITTGATLADGGNISITTTGSIVHLTNSQITTSVQSGVGGGGNILIDSDLVVLDDSRILANAFGGPGGNIDIFAKVFLVNSGGMLPTSLAGIVDASSALSTPGVINIDAAFTDVSGEVAQLPEAPLQATELLRASCAARFAGGKASSLVLGGRDGVPIQPGGLLPSPILASGAAGSLSTGTKTSGNDLPMRFSLLGPARNLTQYTLLPNVKCAF